MAQHGEPAAAQINPAKLPRGDIWERVCGLCGLVTQGGRAGLNTHIAVIHPSQR